MSRCDIEIVFDRADRTYQGGEEVAGVVRVEVNKDTRCDGLTLEQIWRTHGKGNRHEQSLGRETLTHGQWQAGEAMEFPFRIQAPDAPLTYRGHHLNVDHYVRVRVDVPWALDPKHEEEFIVTPGPRAVAHGAVAEAGGEKKSGASWGGALFGVILIVIGVFLLIPVGLVLIPLGSFLLFKAARNSLAEKRLGMVELNVTPHAAPGSETKVRLAFTPTSDCNINGIIAKLTAKERCVSGSGTDRTTHTHTVHEQTLRLAESTTAVAGQRAEFLRPLRLPETDAYSFSARDNDLIWEVEVRIDIPLWPDWIKTRPFMVSPQPREIGSLAAQTATRGSDHPQREVRQPEVPRRDEPRVTAAEGQPPAQATPQPAAATIADPAGVAAPPDIPEIPPHQQSPPLETAADVGNLADTLRGIREADDLSGQRDRLLAESAGRPFLCQMVVDEVGRNYGYSHDTPSQFREGRVLKGRLASDNQAKVEILIPKSRNEEVDELRRGDAWQGQCRLHGWDDLYDRAELRAVE